MENETNKSYMKVKNKMLNQPILMKACSVLNTVQSN